MTYAVHYRSSLWSRMTVTMFLSTSTENYIYNREGSDRSLVITHKYRSMFIYVPTFIHNHILCIDMEIILMDYEIMKIFDHGNEKCPLKIFLINLGKRFVFKLEALSEGLGGL